MDKNMDNIQEKIDHTLTNLAINNKSGHITFKPSTVKKVASLLGLPKPYPKPMLTELKNDMVNQYAAKGKIKNSHMYQKHYMQKKACTHIKTNNTLLLLAILVLLVYIIYCIWVYLNYI